ncbi:unnamed protein product [Caenorhabditis bovis]|uniref:Transcription factor CBF/NF-Y/archaeal histone domain-containing protein n=1 Tax=Caenorhabditis bovis TaxID=2654633 RepID=A0A8S1EAP6_9PELO|nr:unnamed protein product [Caenorhabditis bovis]
MDATTHKSQFAVPLMPPTFVNQGEIYNVNSVPSNTQMLPSTSTSNFAVPQINNAQNAINSSAAGVIRRRRFSTAKIQPTRIKKVMQSDEEIGRMVQSVPVSIGRAMEHFAEKFLQAAADATLCSNSKTLTPQHMKQAMISTPHFAFLETILGEVALPKPSFDAAVSKYVTNIKEEMDLKEKMNMEAATLAQAQFPINDDQNTILMQQNAFQNVLLPKSELDTAEITMSPITPTTSLTNGMMEMLRTASKQIAATNASTPSSVRLNGIKRLSTDSFGPDDGSEKPKRGRPKKKKPDNLRCIDDDLVDEATKNIAKEDKDREMMPPPSLPIGAIPRQ